MNYDIMLADQPIGTAEVIKEGLYYHFRCHCRLSGDVMYQIMLRSNEKECSLGVCVPVGEGFGVDTRLPIKKVGTGELSFYAVPKHGDINGKFIPIRADEPFMYLHRLENARFQVQNGEAGVLIL